MAPRTVDFFNRQISRVGRRGVSLVILGTIFILIGIGNVITAPDVKNAPPQALAPIKLALLIMPLNYWGWVFILTGVFACINSRYPPGRDAYGFALMTFVALMWAGIYVTGWIYYGAHRAWLGAASFALIGLLTQIIAGWDEVPHGSVVAEPRNFERGGRADA